MPDIFSAEPQTKPTPTPPLPTVKVRPRAFITPKPHHPLSSFISSPRSIKFVAKEASEEIILLLRRHPITNLGWILVTMLLLLAPFALSYFPILSFLPERYQFIAVVLWYLICVAYAFESFLDWFFNICVITNETVFDVDFTNLIYREISEADLDHIQDVTVRMGGVIRTMFDYGDVYIQTAGEVPRLEFEAVPHPDRVAKILRECMFKEEKREKGGPGV